MMHWSIRSAINALCQWSVVAIWITVPGVSFAATDEQKEQVDFFEQRIRPVLAEHCYECHSEASDSVEGRLTLDTREGTQRGGESGRAVVPGDVEASLLIRALRYESDSIQMPPAGKLPDHVIRDFQTWIERGAIDPRLGDSSPPPSAEIDVAGSKGYWAFKPLSTSCPPNVGKSEWSRDSIDRFVFANLEQAGLQPAPQADERTRIRRLYFDLIGLPPRPEQVAEFGSDVSPVAWQNAVDRLLASPGFAEHWTRKWLDVVRYADSNGNDFNATYHQAWKYRDYVMKSIAADKPYDWFVREQLAGDLMSSTNQLQRAEQLIATAFLMLGPKMLSERDKEKLQLDVVDEQIDTYGKAFLGLTLGCARCHDHKFDPIPTHDYYALAGVFFSTTTLEGEIQEFVSNWVERELPTNPQHAQQLTQFRQLREKLQIQINQVEDQRSQLQSVLDQTSLRFQGIIVDNGEAEVHGSWQASKTVSRFVGNEYLHDDNQNKGEKSVVFSATIPTTGMYEIRIAYAPSTNRATNVPLEIRHRENVERLFLDQTQTPKIDQLFEPLGTYLFAEGTQPILVVRNAATDGYVIADAVQLIPIPDGKHADRGAESFEDDSHQIAELRGELTRLQDQARQLKEQLSRLDEQSPAPAPRAMAVRDALAPSDLELRIRGVHSNHGPRISRGFLQVLSAEGSRLQRPEASGRLELARWTTSSAKPLLARVFVNRVWHHLMGAGIVRTCDNFGRLGDMPSHPALLDQLAADFVRHDWSIKYLVRRIVLSRSYQMQIIADRHAEETDPDNRLLWRANRKRLTAEQLRDAMLTVSCSLDLMPGESPVAELGQLVNDNSANGIGYERLQSQKRSLYVPIIRNELSEFFGAFDFADPDRVVGRRPETNVPAQALLLMNHPFVRQCAENLAVIVLKESNDDRRLQRLYQTLFQRDPDSMESWRDRNFIQGVLAEARDPSNAGRLAWTDLCHALLASTEFRYLD